jgi:hypothetical protein
VQPYKVPNHLKLKAIVGWVKENVAELRCEQVDYYPNEPLSLGHVFTEVVLFEWKRPPVNDTNPWPIQIWPVNLRATGAGDPVIYPGSSTWVQLCGYGLESLAAAISGISGNPNRGVGMR